MMIMGISWETMMYDDVTLRKCGFIFLGIEWDMNGKYPLAMTNNLRSRKITIKKKGKSSK